MKFWKRLRNGMLLLGMAELFALAAGAQAVRVNRQRISALPDAKSGSLTVAVSPSSMSFSLVSGGVAAGTAPANVTTTWSGTICQGTCTMDLYAYFTSPTEALSGGSPAVYIPSSEVLGQMTTGTPTTMTAFTQSGPVAGGSLLLFSQSIVLRSGNGSRTDTLKLEINLSSQRQLPAGTYSGTVYIQAQAL